MNVKLLVIASLFGCCALKQVSFASFSIPYKSGDSKIKVEFEVTLRGDEVFFDTPFFSLNDGPIACACGNRALKVSAKDGKVTGYCPLHTPKEEKISYLENEYMDCYAKLSEERLKQAKEDLKIEEEKKRAYTPRELSLFGKDVKKK